jgi:hypothetical protein
MISDVDWTTAIATVEAALVARALGRPAPSAAMLAPDVELAARCAVAAKFLAVSTPRTLALINLGPRALELTAAQAAYAPPREILTWSTGEPARALAVALAADIVIAAGPVVITRAAIRGGTHLAALDPGVELAPDLIAAAEVYDVSRLATVVAGLVDGRQLDEITVLVCGG